MRVYGEALQVGSFKRGRPEAGDQGFAGRGVIWKQEYRGDGDRLEIDEDVG